MASEIKLRYASGLTGIKAYVYSNDGSSSRNSGNAVTLTEAQTGLYVGDCTDIQTGDHIVFWDDDTLLGGQTYEPAGFGTITAETGDTLDVGICNHALGLIGAESISATDTDTRNYNLCERFYPQSRDEVISSHPWNFARVRGYAIEADTPHFGYDYAYYAPDTLPNGSDSVFPQCLRVLKLLEWDDEYRVEKDLAGNIIILTDYSNTPDDWADDTAYVKGDVVSYSNITYICNTGHTSVEGAGDDTDVPSSSDYWTSTGGDSEVCEIEYIYQVTTVTNIPSFLKQSIVYSLASKLAGPLTGDMQTVQKMYELSIDYIQRARSIDAQEGTPAKIKTDYWLDAR
jgi:hypothetical protein